MGSRNPYLDTIGPVIRRRRKALQINLTQLADRSGLAKGFLSEVENSKRKNLTLDSIFKVAIGLRTTICDLLRECEMEGSHTSSTMAANHIAKDIVSGLFRNGFNEVGERLQIMDENNRNLGGWCKHAVIDGIERILKKFKI